MSGRGSAWIGAVGERGVTLTELTIIGVLATIVMLALTGFYFNSQRMWMDTSTKAMAQRDATLIVETLRQRVHEANQAVVDATTDPVHNSLTLNYRFDRPVVVQWEPSDSLIHVTRDGNDLGAIGQTHVLRFQLTWDDAKHVVGLPLLEQRTANGDTVRIASQFQLLGG